MNCTDCDKEITHGYFRMIDDLEIYLECYECHEANNG